MAVHCATNADYLKRTSGFLNQAASSTVMCWAKFPTVAVSPAYQTPYILIDAIGTYTDYIAFYGESVDLRLDGNMTAITTTPPSAGVWYHLAWVQSGTTQFFFVNGVQIGSQTYNRAAVAITLEQLGSDSLDHGDVSIAYCREWQAALSTNEILAEMSSSSAVRTSNLFLDTPLVSDLLDVSGNGHNWTQVGSGSFVAGPLAANASITTATALGALPQTLTTASGFIGDAWYSYVPPTGQVVMGYFAVAALTDTVKTAVWLGPTSAPVPYIANAAGGIGDFTPALNVPLEVPVTPGTTYYFQTNSIVATSIAITINAQNGPSGTIPVGAIYTNDDHIGFPAAALSPTNGVNYTIIQHLRAVGTASEQGGDVLNTGTVLLASDDDFTYKLYNGQFTVLASINTIAESNTSIVRTSVGLQQFYVAPGFGSVLIYPVDSSGNVGSGWILSSGTGIRAMAPNNDGTIIYVSPTGLGNSSIIKRWLTGSSTFGTDLAAAVASHALSTLLVLGNGTIVALYAVNTGAFPRNRLCRRYNDAGTILNTYTLPTILGGFSSQSLFHAVDDPTSFWVRIHDGVALGVSTYYNIRASDGTVLSTVNQATFKAGVYQAAASLTPLARFGDSDSCPSFILREQIDTGTASLEVIKVTVPTGSTQAFTYTTTGLTPDTFTLHDGEMQNYTSLTPGSGFGVTEDALDGWTTTYDVSNGNDHEAITLGAGDAVTVTVTNTFISAAGRVREYFIRRERWFPVINQEQMRLFFSMLQIDLQAGNGLTTGQGSDPIMEIDWSDDGGWTWSNIRFSESGKIGQYNRRVIERMLGQSRSRVFRIAVTDPVQWVVVDGYMQVLGGTN